MVFKKLRVASGERRIDYAPLHSGRSKEEQAAFIKQIPAGRFGQPSEIANAVVFLASDEAAFTVGAEFANWFHLGCIGFPKNCSLKARKKEDAINK